MRERVRQCVCVCVVR